MLEQLQHGYVGPYVQCLSVEQDDSGNCGHHLVVTSGASADEVYDLDLVSLVDDGRAVLRASRDAPIVLDGNPVRVDAEKLE